MVWADAIWHEPLVSVGLWSPENFKFVSQTTDSHHDEKIYFKKILSDKMTELFLVMTNDECDKQVIG